MTDAEIARLQAAAAAAAAKAARLEAEAAAAALAAATAAAESPNLHKPAASTPLSGYPAEVQASYRHIADTNPSITIGAMIDEDGSALAQVPISVPLATLNRHGLISGATGTGKTRTLQLLAEQLARAGVPSLVTDVKGDLTGIAEAGTPTEKLLARTSELGQHWQPQAFNIEYFTVNNQPAATALRTTVTAFGPLLLARVLGLNDTQESALTLIFHWADKEHLELIDLTDLREVIDYLLSDEGKPILKTLGGISSATAGVILREIATLQAQGGDDFFGVPDFATRDLLRTSNNGQGIISLLSLPQLATNPRLATTLIMWLIADLFSGLDEVGDTDKPRLTIFFDEAHLLFADASKAFIDQVIHTVRLIRSKGVGIIFITQHPTDLPEAVLGQLGAKIQHALRAFTPKEQKQLRATVDSLPVSPLDLSKRITELGTGEALISVLDGRGIPTPVAPTKLYAPQSVMGPANQATLQQLHESSRLAIKYGAPMNPYSAFEKLAARKAEHLQQQQAAAAAEAQAKAEAERRKQLEKEQLAQARRLEQEAKALRRQEQERQREQERAARQRNKLIDSVVRSVGGQLGREITRSIFGTSRRRK
ncbi:helicase HerA-like domain-containing protein [Corynebacterium choanae]|uniref:AAA-like domain protein n=1 Tax=Corynebacterium choanae TaxID=1862358 RepID=A0A3G6J3V9_9CORY|nr:helicase HerA-like domain-containing protein [Corynebacterium choanae]AZA12626.1 AAA-like domain protein [Corynebacterium choanae]